MARRNKRNRRRRRGSFSFLYKMLCLVVIVGAIAAAMAVFFKADYIEITGNSRYTTKEVLAASELEVEDNLFFLNKYAVAEKICAALPYVESVQINRRLPDALCIRVQECVCRVALQYDGKAWILCDSGKIVDVMEPEAAQGFAQVTGVTPVNPQVGAMLVADEQTQLALDQLMEMIRQLRSKEMLPEVQEIHLEEASVITLRYLDRFDVELLWGADFDYKFSFLQKMIQKMEDYERGKIKLTRDGEGRFIAE